MVCYIMGSNGKPEIYPDCLALVVIAHKNCRAYDIKSMWCNKCIQDNP